MYIFDIDGTLADATHRLHHILGKKKKDWDAWDADTDGDTPIIPIVGIIQALYDHSHDIMLLTGRNERVRELTEQWLADHNIRYHHLIMRPHKDHRDDTIVKLEQLNKFLSENPDVEVQTIFEDRRRLVVAFREAGFHVCQVDEGNF
jgi:phosphoglycolate phosphatase-like HAD superfamily hydrolase